MEVNKEHLRILEILREKRAAFYAEQAEALKGRNVIIVNTHLGALIQKAVPEVLGKQIKREFNLEDDERGYGKVFNPWLGGNASLYDITQREVTNLDGVDLVAVTGSPSMLTEKTEWMRRLKVFLLQVRDAKIPAFMACFAHQAISEAAGAKVDWMLDEQGQRVAREFGVVQMQATKVGSAHPFMQSFTQARPDTNIPIHVAASHSQEVCSQPANAEILATNALGKFCMIAWGERVISTQHHFELTPDIMIALAISRATDIEMEMRRTKTDRLENHFAGAQSIHELIKSITQRASIQTDDSIAFFKTFGNL